MPDSKESPSAVKTDKREVSLGWWYLIALIVLVLDQLTKTWVIAEFYLGQREIITSFFNLVHVHNYGAAFSFLSDAGGWQRWFFA
ncbi:MAG: signal peptidase II, partial [Porticoccaceae bacterium]|nr:signal peptidase II [Porticoccaceae bacterium]